MGPSKKFNLPILEFMKCRICKKEKLRKLDKWRPVKNRKPIPIFIDETGRHWIGFICSSCSNDKIRAYRNSLHTGDKSYRDKFNNSGFRVSKQEKRTRKIWYGMFERCYSENSSGHKYYLKKGITVCKRWHVFDNFLKDMGLAPEGRTLDRINNNRGYSPKNCRWATHKDQARNRDNNTLITWRGQRKCLIEWSLEIGIPRTTLSARIKRGWSVSKAFKTPIKSEFANKKRGRKIAWRGEERTIAEWGRKLNLSAVALVNRIDYMGWSIERALTEPLHRSGRPKTLQSIRR